MDANYYTTYLFKIHKILKLESVAECSTGGHYGIAELQACYVSF